MCLNAGAMGRQDAESETLIPINRCGIDVAHTLRADGFDASENPASGPDGVGVQEGIAYTLEARSEVQAVGTQWAVRRLTPTECERLQGFPDGHTYVPYRGKGAADGPRYKAIGNSMVVNAMRWIGMRIDWADKAAQADLFWRVP